MRVVIVGAGHVGLTTGVCLAEWGHEVHAVDRDAHRVELLQSGLCPIREEGLPGLLRRNLQDDRLSFAAKPGPELADAAVVFLCVDTPAREDGSQDLSRVFEAARSAAAWLDDSTLVVVKSTVPIGASRRVGAALRDQRPEAGFEVASNPEFLRAGLGVADFMSPARVVIGAESERARAIFRELYRPLASRGTPLLFCSPESAELVKHASNVFLAAKVAFANELADLCERGGADVRDVLHAVGLDERIGKRYLRPGPGFGGPCLPKDVSAFVHASREAGAPSRVAAAVLESNRVRPKRLTDRLAELCEGSLESRIVTVLGLAFKPGADDFHDSPSVALVAELLGRGAAVRAHDPSAAAAKHQIPSGVLCFEDAYQAARGADAVVIATAWSQYADLDLNRLRRGMRRPLIVDLPNLYEAEEVRALGFAYCGVGQPRARRGLRNHAFPARRPLDAGEAAGSTTHEPGAMPTVNLRNRRAVGLR